MKDWKESLKEDFYKEFGSFHAPCNLENTMKSETDDWEIINFYENKIASLLSQQRKEVLEEVIEKLPNEFISICDNLAEIAGAHKYETVVKHKIKSLINKQ